MGNCSNVISHQAPKRTYELCPEDTGSFDKASSLRKNYEGVLTAVKIQSIADSFQNSEFRVDFDIDDVISMSCQLSKSHQRSIRWFFSKQFKLFFNDYQIRTKFLRISIINQQNKKLHGFKVNLYRILTGPFRHDFSIGTKQRVYGRLIFDLKLSEIIEVELSTINAKVNLNKQHQGDKFNFAIQSYVNSNIQNKTNKDRLDFKSIPSYKQEVPLQIQASNKLDSVLKWSRKQKDQMPKIKFQIKSSEILSTVFTMKLFKFLDDRKFTEFGQFGFTFSELMSADVSKNDGSNGKKQYKLTKIEKNLNSHGKIQGKCQVQLEVRFDKFIIQALNSCLTEDGIINMNHHERYKANSDDESQTSLKMCLTNILLLTEQKPYSSSLIQRSALSSSISGHLRQLHVELIKNSKHCYVYKDRKCEILQNKKTLLVEILNTLAYLIEENDIELSQLCWNNVIAVMGRAEMMLKYWEFDQEEQKELSQSDKSSCKPMKFLQQKLEVSLEYLRVIHKLLRLALDTQNENSLNGQKRHNQIFKAYCYFRIPSFRQKLLDSINVKLQSGTNLSKKLQKIQILTLNNQQIPLELDWLTRFQSILLAKVGKTQQLFGQLNQLLQNHAWFHCIVKIQENQAYCNFVRYLLAKFCQAREVFKLQKWVCFQGYSVIIKGFLYNLFTIELCDYDNNLIIAIMSLLQNEKLASLLIQTLFKKTNLFDLNSILRLAFVLTHILHALTKNKSLDNFPYVSLMSPIKEILEADHSLSSSYFLTFLYTFYDKFQKTFRYQLGSYLLGKLFWKLCYSWSHNVRKIFYHFVILKIGQDQIVLSTTDMGQKLDIICRIIANGERNNFKSIQKNTHRYLQSQKDLHKALKKKLLDKKKASLNQNDSKNLQQQSIKQYLSFFELSRHIDDPKLELEIVNYSGIDRSEYREQSQNSESRPALMKKDLNKVFKSSTQLQLYKTPRFEKKMTYLSHKLFYPCFRQSDFIIPEIDEKQYIERNMQEYMRYLGKQFRKVVNSVNDYYSKHEDLPTIQFQFKVQVDQRDILPDDFQDMNF